MTTYGELAAELGFHGDWSGFVAWTHRWWEDITPGDIVDPDTAALYREMADVAMQRVTAGVALLDTLSWESDWRGRLNWGHVDIADITDCVLGQLFESYSQGLWRLEINSAQAATFGFVGSLGASNAQLTRAWRTYGASLI